MPIEFTCGGCENVLRVPDIHAGKQARCPQCQTLNMIPDESLDSPKPTFASLPVAEAANEARDKVNPYQASVAGGGRHYRPHRGGMILAMGIISLFCNFLMVPGILAWVMGRSDLKSMDAGLMDPTGRGITQAGMIIGIIGTILVAALILFYAGIIALAVVFAAAGG